MGAPEYRIVYTDPAEQDLRDIFSFTLRRWGRDQLNTYAEKIDQTIAEITANPQIGRPRLGLLRITVGRHYIYYRIEAETIYIIRVLHDRMDAVRHLA
ncbi:type II toxin-antitoxin system RelE/ParE family toxin [Asticcacaulis tiandongensis]|uniref:type II toxin-antitoxin system RelE/ParE family toxin n=1 Tax=Asticcacaulis tiandongensis TaxID=2565365 RepID=UPI00112E3E84